MASTDSPKPRPRSSHSFAPYFPDELITEILYRLPAKSLVKFNCVSKPWLSLISSSGFIKTHLEMSAERDDYHGIIISALPWRSTVSHLRQSPVSSLLFAAEDATTTNTITEVAEIGYPVESPGNSSFWGSCNGLICTSNSENDVFLWNPSVKKCKKLPGITLEKNYSSDKGIVEMYGFGYDMVNDDYKVVYVIGIYSLSGDDPDETEVKVYSLKKDSWRHIGEFEGGLPLIGCGHCASGNIHWLKINVDGTTCKLVGLDLADETFGEIECPNISYKYDWNIGVLGGCLCVIHMNKRLGVDVWVMKEYRVEDSWTKVCSVSYFDCPSNFGDGFNVPVGMLRDGKVLLIVLSVLVLIDPKSNTCRWYPQANKLQLKEAYLFVESLVSPDLLHEEPRQLPTLG